MTISPEWSRIAERWLGLPSGRHCHWCRHITHDEGASYCGNPASKFSDGDRIRTWDGEHCAAASIVDIFQLWEMENKPHPMSALALVIASLALLRTCDSKDGGGAHG